MKKNSIRSNNYNFIRIGGAWHVNQWKKRSSCPLKVGSEALKNKSHHRIKTSMKIETTEGNNVFSILLDSCIEMNQKYQRSFYLLYI